MTVSLDSLTYVPAFVRQPIPEVGSVRFVMPFELAYPEVPNYEPSAQNDRDYLDNLYVVLKEKFPNADVYVALDGEQYKSLRDHVYSFSDISLPDEAEILDECYDIAMALAPYYFVAPEDEGEEDN